MRIVNIVFVILLILFAGVQYNDPDGLFWALVYGVGALWCGLAAFKSGIFVKTSPFLLYIASFVAAIFGVIWFWPTTPNWWTQDVWWETETAREGMGMMILAISLLAAGLVAWQVRTRRGITGKTFSTRCK